MGCPVVVVGGWCPIGRHVGGGWTYAAVQNRQDRLTLEVGVYLDLSCLIPRPKEPLRLGPVACPSFESHLRPTFRPTLPLNVLGHRIAGSQMQTGR